MSKAMQLYPGLEPFPGYRLIQALGRGGFAQVWEAETTRDGRRVALKFMPCRSDLSAAKEIRSIQIIRQMPHPHLIVLEQVWCHPGYIVIAMELADGSLLDLWQKYQDEANQLIEPELVCVYLAQAATALDMLNARQHTHDGQRVGFQHCDIKPSNLLLFGDIVKISDFGLSSPTSAPIKSHRRAGTLQYTAPEVFQGKLSDWTDQYALAVTYCQLRGGRLPFADTPGSFKRHYTRPAPDLSMLTEAEQAVIARALLPIPQDRWPTCTDMMSELARVLA